MPAVRRPDTLAKVYSAAKKKIDTGEVPTLLLQRGQTLFRSINPDSPYTFLPKPPAGTHVSKMQANRLLAPGDGPRELNNRFSGPSYNPAIPCASALYFVLQQQALVNESMHYSGKAGVWALSGRCVIKIRLMGSMLVADLSPHNPQGLRFLRELGAGTWEEMVDSEDCSVARGIGSAIAQSAALRGISVQTVRSSERSVEERGDNLVLFSPMGAAISGIYIEEARYYGNTKTTEIFPVAFP